MPRHRTPLTEAAARLSRQFPGHRVEILHGRLTATPPADGRRARTLTRLTVALHEAGAERAGLETLQRIGIRLPTGEDDYAIPDLSLVEADSLDHKPGTNCYEPDTFRLIVEITSPDWSDRSDAIGIKVDAYARADVPAYVIADRHHDEVVIHTDPRTTGYHSRRTFKRGMTLTLPDYLGVAVALPVDMLLD